MSRVRHDSYEAERLAALWHHIGAVLSGMTTIIGVGGLLWHLWGARQHEEAIKELRLL